MKKKIKIIGALLLGTVFCGTVATTSFLTEKASAQTIVKVEAQNAKEDLALRAKSAYVMEYSTETPVYTKAEREHLPIASMCKIMTLLLSFEGIESGALSMDENVCVSERAASMGGSQVFLEANAEYPVRELIKSIVVCSANDSCVAMAERLAGSESIFVERMNERAKQLGANDTLFANCTGLPKEPQYSCAKDVALMLKALLKHEEYYEFGKVWMDKFAHPKGRYTEITNTNKLVRFYDGCDGGKTGFTNEAGFCLAATAKRNDMRVISVVIGEENSANRFEDVRTSFDYAFANYTSPLIVEAGQIMEKKGCVDGGKKTKINAVAATSLRDFVRRGEKSDVRVETRLERVKAPVKKGEKIGELIVYKNGIECGVVDLLAAENVGKATYFDRIKEIAGEWNG